ncbi:MAG: hypothetical protein JWQ74_718 [Marmoricola sp.]|nr:hypothetical protein [Marmoricola sp.]
MGDLIDELVTDRTAAGITPLRRPIAGRARFAAFALIVLGALLLAAPVATQMFSRAPQGAMMLSDFKPFMTPDRLAGFSRDIATIDGSVAELDAAGARGLSPAYADFSSAWPRINDDMSGLMDDVTDNLDNYQAVAGLPSFSLFPWFFVAPGVILVGVGASVLLRRRWSRGAQVGLAVIGIGLVAAPLAFGMFSKAPKGGEMMDAFQSLETTENVTRIQGYFSTMAVGQGAIRLEVVPALEKAGTTAAGFVTAFPATEKLNRDWVHILNDMTPMIGAMSDNVDSYDALTALPPFPLFPWFFLIPGAVIVGLVVLAGRPRRTDTPPGGTP